MNKDVAIKIATLVLGAIFVVGCYVTYRGRGWYGVFAWWCLWFILSGIFAFAVGAGEDDE